MMAAKANVRTIQELERLIKRYAAEIEDSGLSRASKVNYIKHADMLRRWAKGEFVLGGGHQGRHPARYDMVKP